MLLGCFDVFYFLRVRRQAVLDGFFLAFNKIRPDNGALVAPAGLGCFYRSVDGVSGRLGIGAALLHSVVLAWIPLVFGWVLLELTNKTWATGYMEALRSKAVGNKITASRAHRAALQDFMSFKSAGGAVGCSLAAFLTPAAAPWLVAALAAGCWLWLENPPKVIEEISATQEH